MRLYMPYYKSYHVDSFTVSQTGLNDQVGVRMEGYYMHGMCFSIEFSENIYVQESALITRSVFTCVCYRQALVIHSRMIRLLIQRSIDGRFRSTL
jgi:hypothetical protein